MKNSKAKSTNALMKHLRQKGISITGSKDKRDLQNIGYYHGYKGYRFYKQAHNAIPFGKFSELKAVYDFDMKLKAWFYPHIMFIETALKNRVLDFSLDYVKESDFGAVYTQALNAHTEHRHGGEGYKKLLKDKIDLRKQIYTDISQYATSPIVQHFYDRDKMIPLWGIFEFLTLGEFGRFYNCLKKDIKLNICDTLHINKGMNTTGDILGYMIFAMKDLRNAVAHNSPIFDVRFNDQSRKAYPIPKILYNYLMQEFKLPAPDPYYGKNTRIDFQQIIDYFLLIMYLLKQLGISKTELKKQTREFEQIFSNLEKAVPKSIYDIIVPMRIDFKFNFFKLWI